MRFSSFNRHSVLYTPWAYITALLVELWRRNFDCYICIQWLCDTARTTVWLIALIDRAGLYPIYVPSSHHPISAALVTNATWHSSPAMHKRTSFGSRLLETLTNSKRADCPIIDWLWYVRPRSLSISFKGTHQVLSSCMIAWYDSSQMRMRWAAWVMP